MGNSIHGMTGVLAVCAFCGGTTFYAHGEDAAGVGRTVVRLTHATHFLPPCFSATAFSKHSTAFSNGRSAVR